MYFSFDIGSGIVVVDKPGRYITFTPDVLKYGRLKNLILLTVTVTFDFNPIGVYVLICVEHKVKPFALWK